MTPARSLIVADIGGTNARFAVATRNAGRYQLHNHQHYPCSEHPDFESALDRFLGTLSGEKPAGLCVGIAGPVENNAVAMTNLDWQVNGEEVRQNFRLEYCHLINDFTALACGMLQLDDDDLTTICPGVAIPDRVRCIVGPGTGLGVASLVPANGHWVCLPSEGGHATLAASNAFENQLIRHVSGGRGRIPASEILSGRGLLRLYEAICELEDQEIRASSPADVTRAALDGADPNAIQTVSVFLRLLGGFTGDVALTVGAKGGVCLAGGILPRIVTILRNGEFEACFREKGAMSHYLADIRVSLITAKDTALIGAAISACEM